LIQSSDSLLISSLFVSSDLSCVSFVSSSLDSFDSGNDAATDPVVSSLLFLPDSQVLLPSSSMSEVVAAAMLASTPDGCS
jgi:hypothetical protein